VVTLITLLACVIFVVVCSTVAFAAGYAVALARLRSPAPEPGIPAQETEADRPSSSIVTARIEPTHVAFARLATEGTPEWGVAMEGLGARMRSAGTRLVVFVHGSFVGDDPLALARTLEGAVPRLPDLSRALRGFTRAQISRFLGDLSNFSRDYVDTLAASTGIEAIDFTWSGENHHAARVQEAVRLGRALALHAGLHTPGGLGAGARVLLVGHSHGGQLFAVLSQLLARSRGYDELVAAAAARGEDVVVLEDDLELLRRCTFDVATFGTPPRYDFASGARFRLLHVVNHRQSAARASLHGLLHTRRGDYVHHLGAPGSDWPAASAKDRRLNERLDRVLGVGTDFRAWLRHIAQGLRFSPHGHTVLVDYGDQGRVVPNFWATGFGHAAYTRRDAMLFHLRLVADHFYPEGQTAEATPIGATPLGHALMAAVQLRLPWRRPPSSPTG
jgi:hypothetical protein